MVLLFHVILYGNRLTLRLSAITAGITARSVYEVNDKEVLSSLNRDRGVWGHAGRSTSLLWSGTCVQSRDKVSLTRTAADTSPPPRRRHEGSPFAAPSSSSATKIQSRQIKFYNQRKVSQTYQCHGVTGGSSKHMLSCWRCGPLLLFYLLSIQSLTESPESLFQSEDRRVLQGSSSESTTGLTAGVIRAPLEPKMAAT